MHRGIFTLTWFLAGLLTCAAQEPGEAEAEAEVAKEPEAETYKVVLHRPAKVGEVYSYSAVGRMYRQIDVTVDSKTAESSYAEYQCQLASSVEILNVGESGLPTEMKISVFRFQKQSEGDRLALDLLGRGSVIHYKITPEGEEFLVGGEPVREGITEALSMMAMKLSSLPGATDDSVMGVKEPKAEGEKWAIDNALVAAALAKNGFHIHPGALRADAQLSGVTKPGADETGFISVQVNMVGEGISPELPKGYALKSGKLTNHINRRLPLDLDTQSGDEEASFEIIADAEGTEAESKVGLKIHLRQSIKARYNRVAVKG